MRQIRRLALSCLIAVCLAGLPLRAVLAEPRNTVIYDFTGGDDGEGFRTGLTVDPGGVVYGISPSGGKPSDVCTFPNRCGRVFRLLPPATQGGSWTYEALHDFVDGTDGRLGPTAPTLDDHGNIYGVSPVSGIFPRLGGGSV